MTFNKWLRDTTERAMVTFVQAIIVFLPVLLAGHYDSSAIKAIVAAVIPAVGSVVLNAVTAFVPSPATFSLDLAYRGVRTFVITVLSAITGGGFNLFDVTAWRALGLAALMAVAVLLKGAVVKKFAAAQPMTPASLAAA
jgi:hypothetical protein